MDCVSEFDSLMDLLIRYPPKGLLSRSPETKRRLASFFKEEDFPKDFNSLSHSKPKASNNENKFLQTQKTKDLMNEILSDMKAGENTEIFDLKTMEDPQEGSDPKAERLKKEEITEKDDETKLFLRGGLAPEEKSLSADNSNEVLENNQKEAKSKTFPMILERIEEICEENQDIAMINNNTLEPLMDPIVLKVPCLEERKSHKEDTPNFQNDHNPPLRISKDDIVHLSSETMINQNLKEYFTFDSNTKTVSFSEENFANSPIKNQISLPITKQTSEIAKNTKKDEDSVRIEEDSLKFDETSTKIVGDGEKNFKKEDSHEKYINTKCFSLPIEDTPNKEPMKESGSPTHPLKKRTKLEQSFHINKWGELQTALKKEYNLINQENELRNRLISDLLTKHYNYYRNYLKLKTLKLSLNLPENSDAKTPNYVLFEDPRKILRDMTENIQGLLKNLIKQPRKMAQMVFKQKTVPMSNKFEALLETLSKTFFEDLTTEEPFQIGFLRFVDEIVKLEINGFNDFASFSNKLMSSSTSLIDKIFNHMLANEQCEKYLKFLLKNPLISIIKTKPNLEIDPTKIYAKLMNRRKTDNLLSKQKTNVGRLTTSSFLSPNPKSTKSSNDLRKSSNEISRTTDINVKTNESFRYNNDLSKSYDSFYKNAFEEKGASSAGVKEMFVSQMIDERSQFRMTLTPFLSNSARNFSFFAKRTDTINESMNEETPSGQNDSVLLTSGRASLRPTDSFNYLKTEYNDKNLEVIEILEKNISEIKGLLNIFLDSIFSTIYNIPLHVRLVLKILEIRILEKFNVPKEELNPIFSNFLFLKWIIPKFSRPGFTSLGFNIDFISNQTKNLLLLGGILHKVVKSSLYDNSASEFLCFNEFIEENRVYMKEYYEELINIGTNIIDLIESEASSTPESQGVEVNAIFLSLEAVSTVCEYISTDSYEFDNLIKTNITKIMAYDEQNNLFHKLFQIQGYQNLITPSEIYLCFIDINYPCGPFSSFQELLFREPPGPNEESRVLSKTVNLLRKLLISIDKVNSVYTLTGRENVHISDILEMYQEKSHIYDYTELKTKNKMPIETTAKFLNNLIEIMDVKYKANNWKKINERMTEDFDQRSCFFNELLLETKSILSMALENLEKANSSMQVSIEKCLKFHFVKILNEKVIKNLKMPICLTSGDIRVNILEAFRKKVEKKRFLAMEDTFSNGRFMLMKQDECIHQRMDEAGVHCFILTGKQSIKEVRRSFRSKKKDEKEFPAFHCSTIDEFTEALCALPEIKEALTEGNDNYGINSLFTLYLDSLEEQISTEDYFKDFPRIDKNLPKDSTMKEWLKNFLEKYITRKIFCEIFPKEPTYKDAALYSRIKVFDWIEYSHLDICEKNRLDIMWNAATQNLKKLDIAITPLSKLKMLTECFTTIIDSLTLASNKNEGAGADDSLPILIYAVLKATPSRMISNTNFIKLFCHKQRMMSQSGYSFIQLLSAISFVEEMESKSVNMKQDEFSRIVEEKEKQYDVFFQRMKTRMNEEDSEDILLFEKI